MRHAPIRLVRYRVPGEARKRTVFLPEDEILRRGGALSHGVKLEKLASRHWLCAVRASGDERTRRVVLSSEAVPDLVAAGARVQVLGGPFATRAEASAPGSAARGAGAVPLSAQAGGQRRGCLPRLTLLIAVAVAAVCVLTAT